jgi:hypothetical protein
MAADAQSSQGGGSGFAGVFEFARIPSLDIAGVAVAYDQTTVGNACTDETLDGDALFARVVEPHKRLMRYFFMQDKLSDLIFRGNETLGNFLLAGLAVAVVWLITILGNSFRRLYLSSDATLQATFKELAMKGVKNPAQTVAAEYASMFRRLAFARVVGPALGFLLTVSSLVAGLHPSTTATQDTSRFVSSLQLALVATFMGLAVRILAELAIRVEREAAERGLNLAQKESPK